MIYDHPKDEGSDRDSALIRWVWRHAEIGIISTDQVHFYLGRYFKYPPCCIEEFIEEGLYNDGEGGLATDGILGTYYHCKQCYETRRVQYETGTRSL